MKNQFLYKRVLIITLLISLIAPVPTFAAGAGITPDSSLYFFDSLLEKVSLFFTFNSEKRIKKTMSYAEERLAELEVVSNKNKPVYVNQLATKYQHNIGLVSEEIKHIKSEEQAENIFNTFSENTTKQQEKLNEILNKVPEEARPAIQGIIEISLQEHAKAMSGIAALKERVQTLQEENEALRQQLSQTGTEQTATQLTSQFAPLSTIPVAPIASNQSSTVLPSESTTSESSSTNESLSFNQQDRLLKCRQKYQRDTEDLARRGLARSSFRNAVREEYELCVASV